MATITYRIPTEMYAYVEIAEELGAGVEMTPEQIKERYDDFSSAFKQKPVNGISDKDYNAFIDAMLLGNPNHVEMYQAMTQMQKDTVQVIKRSLKRIAAKEINPTIN